MKILKKVWEVLKGFFCGSTVSVETGKSIQKNSVKGNNNGPFINAGENSNINVGANIVTSEEKPENQKTGDIWNEII